MRREFKLIKSYPDCQLLVGDGIEFEHGNDEFKLEDGEWEYSYSLQDCLDYKEFWEEVTPIQIISVRDTSMEDYIYDDINLNTIEEYIDYIVSGESEIYQATNGKEVFTIGDSVHFEGEISTIDAFEYDIENNCVLYKGYPITELNKFLSKTPCMHTTEDGVEIYQYQHPDLYFIDVKSFKTGVDRANTLSSIAIYGYKYFASKTNRDIWIDNNKPIISKQELQNLIKKTTGLFGNPLEFIYVKDLEEVLSAKN